MILFSFTSKSFPFFPWSPKNYLYINVAMNCGDIHDRIHYRLCPSMFIDILMSRNSVTLSLSLSSCTKTVSRLACSLPYPQRHKSLPEPYSLYSTNSKFPFGVPARLVLRNTNQLSVSWFPHLLSHPLIQFVIIVRYALFGR